MDARSYKIVITDSGLGGLSVLAEIDGMLNRNHFGGVDLIFVNALHDKNLGYNKIKSVDEKIEKFNVVLEAINRKYTPDLILIACNTLSVIYNRTHFAETSKTNVIGIVEFGVDLIYDKMKNDSHSRVIIYGTPTTINSNAHKSGLVKKGIESERIINQACYLLETEIQNDAGSKKVFDMITEFTAQAAQNIKGNGKVYAALCCTHYSYSTDIFEKVLSKLFGQDFEILNPNTKMSEYAVTEADPFLTGQSNRIEIVSKTEISESEINSLKSFLEAKSPATLTALRNYNFEINLF